MTSLKARSAAPRKAAKIAKIAKIAKVAKREGDFWVARCDAPSL
ncbi:MAG TPA: hypothetical protein VHM25_07830 [Polyangiaceae bacterium]|jgi:hypothetical protein|nr:hypothetical protein [Polyangiaceae bacterium]